MRGCMTTSSQLNDAVEPEDSASILLEKEEDAEDSKVIVDYNPDEEHKPEGPDPNNQPFSQEEEKGDSDAKYAKWSFLANGLTKRE